MGFMVYSINSAIDSKYVVVKSMKGQAKVGSLIHVMDGKETSDGVTINYRLTKTKQDYVANFDTLKDFCTWCMPSVFLARYYDKLSHREIIRYIKVENRSFLTFHLPVILICLVLVWAGIVGAALFNLIAWSLGIIIGAVASVLIIGGVFLFDKISSKMMHERLYDKVMVSR